MKEFTLQTQLWLPRPRGGAFIHWQFFRREVERIFRYRQPRMQELFGNNGVRNGSSSQPPI